MTAPTRPILRYFGGKWRLAPWILSHFPPHRIYVEAFGGAGSVLMQKEPSFAEVYNDLDGDVVNVFRVLQSSRSAKKLARQLELTPFARAEFDLSYEPTQDPVERARRLLIKAFMGHGTSSTTGRGKTGFRAKCYRQNQTGPADWATYPVQVQRFCERLRNVCIENRDALEVMAQQDDAETLHFVDPPYVHETRGCTDGYRFEMNDKQHEALCEFLAGLKGMVILCGYRNPIYDRLGWMSLEREALADGASERTEVLWFNRTSAEAQTQLSMFAEAR